MFINVHNKIFTFDSKWNTRCKDSANRRQNQLKKLFFIFFVEMQPILSKDSAKNRFSEEKENKLSFLSVRFLFKSMKKTQFAKIRIANCNHIYPYKVNFSRKGVNHFRKVSQHSSDGKSRKDV